MGQRQIQLYCISLDSFYVAILDLDEYGTEAVTIVKYYV